MYLGRIAPDNLLEDNASVAGCIPYNVIATHRLQIQFTPTKIGIHQCSKYLIIVKTSKINNPRHARDDTYLHHCYPAAWDPQTLGAPCSRLCTLHRRGVVAATIVTVTKHINKPVI
jgi:hypothetical protein